MPRDLRPPSVSLMVSTARWAATAATAGPGGRETTLDEPGIGAGTRAVLDGDDLGERGRGRPGRSTRSPAASAPPGTKRNGFAEAVLRRPSSANASCMPSRTTRTSSSMAATESKRRHVWTMTGATADTEEELVDPGSHAGAASGGDDHGGGHRKASVSKVRWREASTKKGADKSPRLSGAGDDRITSSCRPSSLPSCLGLGAFGRCVRVELLQDGVGYVVLGAEQGREQHDRASGWRWSRRCRARSGTRRRATSPRRPRGCLGARSRACGAVDRRGIGAMCCRSCGCRSPARGGRSSSSRRPSCACRALRPRRPGRWRTR